MLHEGLYKMYDGFPAKAPPMAILSSMINATSCYTPEFLEASNEEQFRQQAARLLSQVRTLAAASYRASIGKPIVYPNREFNYCQNFLHMMFSDPYRTYIAPDSVRRALSQILLLHADHEQNCSTSTVRMVASSGANMYASCAAGVLALWGWRHGGANAEVVRMLEKIEREKISVADYVAKVKRKEVMLMGFGHRVYKSYDPRAKILQTYAQGVLKDLNLKDPLYDIALQLEEVALKDSYFVERNLYPNVDFYSGLILKAIGVPVEMFPVIFAIGRMPGWIANYRETMAEKGGIYRPRQVYQGPVNCKYIPVEDR